MGTVIPHPLGRMRVGPWESGRGAGISPTEQQAGSLRQSRTTNAFLEGLNSVFSAVKRKARGFRPVKNLIPMLYFTAGKLPLSAAP